MLRNIVSRDLFIKERKFAVVSFVSTVVFLFSCGNPNQSADNESNSGAGQNGKEIRTLVAKVDTVFKKSTDSSENLAATDKCQIDAGTQIQVSSLVTYGTHAKIEVTGKQRIPGCQMFVGFVFSEHFSGIPRTFLSRPTTAVLSTIALAEGTNDRYDLIFTFQTFKNFSDHPRTVYCSGELCSNAAGRYQFLDTTWDEVRAAARLGDFSPENQDKAAIYRMQTFRGVTEHSSPLGRAAFERMIFKLNSEWASLPGSPYGQPTKPMNLLWNHYVAQL